MTAADVVTVQCATPGCGNTMTGSPDMPRHCPDHNSANRGNVRGMTSRDFCYWLQGLFELGQPDKLDAKKTDLIRRHLALVFAHEIDPAAGPPDHQKILDDLHDSTKPPPGIPPHWRPGSPKIRC